MNLIIHVAPPDFPRFWHVYSDEMGGQTGYLFEKGDEDILDVPGVYIDSCYLGYGYESPHWRKASINEMTRVLARFGKQQAEDQ